MGCGCWLEVFEFYADDVQVRRAYVLQGVGAHGGGPEGDARDGGGMEAAVHEDGALVVAADEVAPAEEIEGSGPAVGVEGDRVAGWDVDVEDADGFVLKEQEMVARGGDEGVEILRRPWRVKHDRYSSGLILGVLSDLGGVPCI